MSENKGHKSEDERKQWCNPKVEAKSNGGEAPNVKVKNNGVIRRVKAKTNIGEALKNQIQILKRRNMHQADRFGRLDLRFKDMFILRK